MRIAVVAGEYPTPAAPEKAMFVRDQVEALRAAGHRVVVVHHEPPTLRRVVGRVRRGLASVRPARPLGGGPAAPTAGFEPDASDGSSRPPTTLERPTPLLSRIRTLGRLVHDRAGQRVASAHMVRELEKLDPPPEVVHAHNVFPAGLAASRYTGRTNVALVITEHSSAFRRHQLSGRETALAARAYGVAHAVIAVSPSQSEAIPARGVVTIPNVVPSEFTLRRPGAARDGDIVSIGTLMPHKGMDVLVRAYAALTPELRRRHRLVIVGDGPDAPRLHRLVRALGVTESVVLSGQLSRARVADVLRGAAVLVSASPVETFGMTLIEGLAAGVPFVAVRSGGPESVWFEGAGVLVPSSDPDHLRVGIETALASDGGIGALDDEGRRHEAHSRFGAGAVAARLSEVYREARASAGSRTPG